MSSDIENYVKNVLNIKQTKHLDKKIFVHPCKLLFERISLDIVGPLPEIENEFKYLTLRKIQPTPQLKNAVNVLFILFFYLVYLK